jgi:hypothetical protein
VPNYRNPVRPEVGASLCRAIRKLFATEPIVPYIDHGQPGAGIADDDDGG